MTSPSAPDGGDRDVGGQLAAASEGPRGRTLRHLRRLLAGVTSATAGAILLACESCGTCCDPLPPPLECKNNPRTSYLNGFSSWDASWVPGTGGVLIVKVTVTTYVHGGQDSLTIKADPVLVGAKLLSVDRKANALTLTCQPTSGVTVVDLTIPLDCNSVSEELLLQLDVSQPVLNKRIVISPRD